METRFYARDLYQLRSAIVGNFAGSRSHSEKRSHCLDKLQRLSTISAMCAFLLRVVGAVKVPARCTNSQSRETEPMRI